MAQTFSQVIQNSPSSFPLIIKPGERDALSITTVQKIDGSFSNMPTEQAAMRSSYAQIIKVPAETTNPNIFTVNGAFTDIYIRSGTLANYTANELFIEFDLTSNGAPSSFMSMDFCFLRVEITKAQVLLQTIFSEQNYFSRNYINDTDTYQNKARFSFNSLRYYGQNEEEQRINTGQTKRVRLILYNTFFDKSFWKDAVTADLMFRIYWAPIGSNGVLTSGNVANLVVGNIQLYFSVTAYSDGAIQRAHDLYRNNKINIRYSDVTRQVFAQNAIGANQIMKIQLNGFVGAFSHMIIAVRYQGATGLNLINFKRIESVQLYNQSNQPVYLNGTLTSSELLYNQIDSSESDFNHYMYTYSLDFTGNHMQSAMKNSIIAGYYALTSREFIWLETGPVFVQKVYSLTCGASANALQGSFMVVYTSPIYGTFYSDPILVGATAAQIKAAIELMQIFVNLNSFVTVSGPVLPAATITITINDQMLPSSDPDGKINIISSLQDSVLKNNVAVTSFISQHFQPGWDIAPANVEVLCLGFAINELSIDKGEVTVIKG